MSSLTSTDFRVSFISGGDAARNKALIQALYAPPGAQFPERFKKDLLKLIPEIDLANAVLIDDIRNFSIAGQERNKLSWALGVILEARDLSLGVNGASFIEQVKRLTHDSGGRRISRLQSSQLALAAVGLRALGLPASPFVRFPQDALSRCTRKLINP